MRTELPAEGFLRHRGLILVAVGGAVAEGGLLTLVAPAARPIAPQVTSVPSLAAYHDLRWLFTDSQSWFWFAGLVAVVLIVRSALDVALLRLAWPGELPPPRLSRSLASCAALTALAWLLLTPAATLAFGVAVLPFSWPFLAAFPIMFGIVVALSHGGTVQAWWRRLPPLRAVAWLLGSFVALTAAGAVIAHLPTWEALPVIAVAGLMNARAWYGLALIAAQLRPRPHESVPARLVFSLPFAPIAALLVIALVVGVARLMFTGTIVLPASVTGGSSAAASTVVGGTGNGAGGGSGLSTVANSSAAAAGVTAVAGGRPAASVAVLVIGGWGSSCCNDVDGLRAELPSYSIRQFSYLGLGPDGHPLASGPDADDLPLPELGDRLASQVEALHAATHKPVDVVAESEGSLGVYAMLDRHPGLPIGAVVLLSPIVEPGQLSYPPGQDGSSVSEEALDELNYLIGSMSPFGPDGAAELLNSVSEFGARYFASAAAVLGADGKAIHWLAVVPLADAVTLPVCGLPSDVLVVPALHGGLLGDPSVLPVVAQFVSGHDVTDTSDSQLRADAELITGAAAAWRMPVVSTSCPS
ncbi:MAG TPA: hypothetical protein VMF87_12100 [Streptosporangiaceae bacterium]|nr:hypothetical protein [Streptosporangiaceae bacterium]